MSGTQITSNLYNRYRVSEVKISSRASTSTPHYNSLTTEQLVFHSSVYLLLVDVYSWIFIGQEYLNVPRSPFHVWFRRTSLFFLSRILYSSPFLSPSLIRSDFNIHVALIKTNWNLRLNTRGIHLALAFVSPRWFKSPRILLVPHNGTGRARIASWIRNTSCLLLPTSLGMRVEIM